MLLINIHHYHKSQFHQPTTLDAFSRKRNGFDRLIYNSPSLLTFFDRKEELTKILPQLATHVVEIKRLNKLQKIWFHSDREIQYPRLKKNV